MAVTVKEAKDIMRTLDPADPADWQRPEVKEAASVVVKAVDKAEGQLAEARTKGDVPEDARVFDVGSKGDFSYVQVSEVKRLAVKRGKAFRARADSQRDLAEYRKNGGYDLVAAIRAGNISKIRKAQKAGLFTPADVVQAQLATTQVRQIKTKPKEITSKPIKLRFAQRGRALQIPVGATARVTAGKGREEILAAERQMIQYGKSWVPGWLTKENWQRMTPLERAASIAGDIGQTILYIVPVAKGGSMVIGSQPAATAKGTFPIKGTSLKVFSKGDLKAAIKGAKQKELMTARDLKHLKYSVDISRPVEMPLRIAVVKEGPAGVRFLKATDTIFPVKQRLTPGYSKVTIKPTKTGPATSRVEPLAERMTVEQFLRLQGVLPVSIGTLRATTVRPVAAPEPSIKPAIKPKVKPAPAVKPTPAISPEYWPFQRPSEVVIPEGMELVSIKPATAREISQAVAKAPAPTPTPSPQPAAVPKPEIAPKPAALVKAVSAKAQPVTTPVTPAPTYPRGFNRDEDNRRRREIQRARGAIAWRQGELHGKDRWDVITSPYTEAENYTIVLGRKPTGAIIIKGPGSARKTARLVFGPKLKGTVLVNQPGIFSTELAGTGTRRIAITFHRDVDISKKVGNLEEKGRVFPLK